MTLRHWLFWLLYRDLSGGDEQYWAALAADGVYGGSEVGK